MERFWAVLQTVLPVAAVVLCGLLIRRRALVTESGMSQIKAVLVNICLPAVLFRTFYAMRFTWREAAVFGLFACVTLLAFLLGFALSRLFRSSSALTPWLCTTIEGGSVGYALFFLLFGQQNLYHLALLDAGNAVIQWTLVMSALRLRCDGSAGRKETLRSLVTPINLAILAGILCGVSGLGALISASAFGGTLEAVLDYIGTPVGAMILLSVGFDLSFKQLRWGETLRSVLARVLIFTLLGCLVYPLVGRIFPDAALYRSAVLVFFILPPTYAYTVYIRDAEERAFLGGYLALYTLLTIAAFTVLAVLFG